ncbi:unnamed protein product [Ixodes hexagonus]
MEPGSVVKALYDFNSGLEGELPLKNGDLIQVVESVDKHWALGNVCGARGKFPAAFVVEVKLPQVLPGQQLFAATSDFSSDVAGDLNFQTGDLIVGVSAVDDNWWRGRLGGKEGIFPLSHAWQLEAPKTSTGPWRADLWARALQDLSAQLDDEMSLNRGDLVHVTQILDKDWFWGECGGRSGKFPRNFVALVSDIETPELSPSPANSSKPAPAESVGPTAAPPKPQRSFESNPPADSTTNNTSTSEPSEPTAGGYHSLNSGLAPYGRTKFPFVAQYPNELSFGVGELVTLIRHIDDEWTEGELGGKVGLFPTEYVDVIVDCASVDSSDVSSDDKVAQGGACFGRALFDFAGDAEGDLPLAAGEVVVLLGKVNADWYRARSRDGRLGICPTSFVEELVRSSGEPVTPRKMGRFNSAPSCQAEEPTRRRTVPPWGSLAEETEDARELKSLPSVDRGGGTGEAEATLPPLRRANTLSSSDSAAFKSMVQAMTLIHELGGQTEFWKGSIRPFPSYCQVRHLSLLSFFCLGVQLSPAFYVHLSGLARLVESGRVMRLVSPVAAVAQKAAVPRRPPPAAPSSASVSSVPSRTAPPIPLDPWQETPQCSGTSQAAQGAPVRPEEQAAKEEERRRKRRDHRQCVVTELLQTERDYLKALQMCYDIYFSDQAKHKMRSLDIDAITLFGNLDEVIAVSSQLLGSLERELVNPESCQLVGKCFVSVADELREVYGHYCRNHDDVSSLWTKCMASPAAAQFLQAGVERMQQETNCFDLPSVLIRPVQRILKYPLLLNELNKSTEDDHPDKATLAQAMAKMSDVATSINEFKRRKDLVSKYRKDPSESTLSRRLAKLNLHSVLKKSSRFGVRLSSTFGLTAVEKDEQFERTERDFRLLEKALKLFLKNLSVFCDQMKESVQVSLQLSEDLVLFYRDRSSVPEVDRYRSVQHAICAQHWQEFATSVERDVESVLKQLLQMFAGPSKLITKRQHKLLDYAACKGRVDRNRDVTKHKALADEQQAAKNVYSALNTQLLDELPKLCSLSAEILQSCVQEFLRARKTFVGRATRELLTLMELPAMHGARNNSDVLDNFRIRQSVLLRSLAEQPCASEHNPFAALLSKADGGSLSRATGAKTAARLSLGSAPAQVGVTDTARTDMQRVFLKSSYPAECLFVVSQDYSSADILDISLRAGDVVGVVKRQDPMGNTGKWFVDDGMTKGFIAAGLLRPVVPGTTAPARSPRVSPQPVHAEHDPPPPYSATDPMRPVTPNPPLGQILNPSINPAFAAQDKSPSVSPKAAEPSRSPVPEKSVARLSSDGEGLSSYNYSFSHQPPTVRHAYEEIPDQEKGPSIGSPVKEPEPATVSRYANLEFDPLAPMAPQHSEELDEKPRAVDAGAADLGSMFGGARYGNLPAEGTDFGSAVGGVRYRNLGPVPTPQAVAAIAVPPVVNEYHYALYPFSACGPHQLSIAQGQVLRVVHQCDLHGNPEWWFVQDRHGNQGYVPGNYLHKYNR